MLGPPSKFLHFVKFFLLSFGIVFFSHSYVGSTFSATVKNVIPGEILVIKGKRFLVEGLVGTDSKLEFVSLIDITYTTADIPVEVLRDRGDRYVAEFPKSLFHFSEIPDGNFPILGARSDIGDAELLLSRYGAMDLNDETYSAQVKSSPTETEEFTLRIREGLKTHSGSIVTIDNELGSGGLNTVYKATRFEAHSPPAVVALKVPKSTTSRTHFSDIFRGNVLSRNLPPQTLIQTLDSGLAHDGTRNVPFSILEFSPYDTLDVYLKKMFPQGFDTALRSPATKDRAWKLLNRIEQELSSTLASLQEHGLCHGDIKAENFFVEVLPDGNIHLRLNDVDNLTVLGEAHRIFTPGFIPPNQTVEFLKYNRFIADLSTDQFAVKNLIHQLAFGESIYQRVSLHEPSVLIREFQTTGADELALDLQKSVADAAADWRYFLDFGGNIVDESLRGIFEPGRGGPALVNTTQSELVDPHSTKNPAGPRQQQTFNLDSGDDVEVGLTVSSPSQKSLSVSGRSYCKILGSIVESNNATMAP